MSGARTKIERGTLVRYRTEFLRGLGWMTDVPVNGMVVGMIAGGRAARVWWCDTDAGEAQGVAVGNLEIDRRGEQQICDSYREVLLNEWARAGIEFVTG